MSAAKGMRHAPPLRFDPARDWPMQAPAIGGTPTTRNQFLDAGRAECRSVAAVGRAARWGICTVRHGLIALCCVFLCGCANDGPFANGLGPAPLLAVPAEPARDPSKLTLAGKTLAAIALERVTGRKPDPSRLGELN